MSQLIHRQFEQIAAQFPAATAIRFGNSTLTYEALNVYANRIAVLLSTLPDTSPVVNVALASGTDLIAALLGVFKAGRTYLPVDLQFARKRLEQIWEETPDAPVILHRSSIEKWQEAGPVSRTLLILEEDQQITICKDGHEERHALAGVPGVNPDMDVDENGDAYIFYTSGSTGKAKAILGMHKSLAHFINWERATFPLAQGYRVSQLTNFTFDASLRDIFFPLCGGGTLCIPDADTRGNMALLLNWIREEAIELIHCVPSLFQQLYREGGRQQELGLPALKHVLLAGEPLYAKDIHRWQETFGDNTEIVNLYGATETTMIKTFHRIKEVPAAPGQLLPAGQGIDNTFILVMNQGRLCRIGEIGEVYIKTPYASKGYYRQPELTRQVFVQNPLITDREDIIYKTGDLGRYLPDRSLEVLGRQDRQVKVNGVRIELSEIEQAVLSVPGVWETVVETMKDVEGKPQLVCYYTAAEDIPLIREYLLASLNQYMMPVFFLRLPEFPLNSNGKIDKRALPAPDEVLLGKEFDLPQEGLETQLADIWKAVLGLRRIGRDHSFFHLGGSSLKAMKIVGDIQQQLHTSLKLTDIFVYPTIAGLASLIAGKGGVSADRTITPAPVMEAYPLTHTQRRIWTLSQLEEASVAYHITLPYVLKGNVDTPALEQAFRAVINRHESLRTVFRQFNDEVKQVILPAGNLLFSLETEDAGHAPEDAIRAFQSIPFDLENGPLIRAKLFRITADETILTGVLHHIISDGWSVSVLLRDVLHYYDGYTRGDVRPLAAPALQFKDYAVWQQTHMEDADIRVSESFWRKQFETVPQPLELTLDKPRPVTKTFHGKLYSFHIAKEVLDKLKAFCTLQEGTLFDGLTAVMNTLLYRYTGQTDIVFGTAVANREQAGCQDMIGFLANTIPLRNTFRPEMTFLELFKCIQANTRMAFSHAHYPFDRLVEELSLQRDQSRSPLFDIVVALQQANGETLPGAETAVAGVDAAEATEQTGTSKFDLYFSFKETAEGLLLKLEYNTDLFYDARIARICRHVETLIAAMTTAPQLPLHAVDFIPQEEAQLLAQFSNKACLSAPKEEKESVIARFQRQAQAYPDKTAIFSTAGQLTYKELDEQSDRLAAALVHGYGVRMNDYVAISGKRDHTTVMAMLAVLKAGAAYVALEPSLPEDRALYCIRQAQCRLVLHNAATSCPVPEGVPLVSIHAVLAENSGYTKVQPAAALVQYICFTSGSTGIPKGVIIPQSAVLNFIDNVPPVPFTADDCLLNTSPFSFDGCVIEIYGALLFGGSVVVMDEYEVRTPQAYEEVFEKYRITGGFMTTSLFNILADLDFRGLYGMQRLLVGGEAASVTHMTKYLRHSGVHNIYNVYGPTENTVLSTAYAVNAPGCENTVPIGRPLKHVAAFVLDQNRMPVPVGAAGELYLAGAGLALGYMGNEDLQRERFVNDERQDNQRLYRTGDLCKWSEEGQLHFLGRKDDMLKIRGFLVELEEIVGALQRHPAVKEAVVLCVNKDGEKVLSAYMVMHTPVAVPLLKEALGRTLPAYMIPQYFTEIPQMPLNNNGKTDRDALLKLPLHGTEAATIDDGPLTPAQQLLKDCWKKVLKRDDLSIHDNFYELGGDSIKGIQLVSMLKKKGYSLAVKTFMQSPTIFATADKLTKVKARSASLLTTGTMQLSPIQARYFRLGEEPLLHHFCQSVKVLNTDGFDIEAVEAALNKLVQHHDALRSRFFKNEAGQWQQEIPTAHIAVTLPVYDLRNTPDAETAFNKLASGVQSSVRLDEGGMLRAAIFRKEEGDVLLLVIHHLAVDGVSWRILFDDFGQLYQQYVQDRTIGELPSGDSFRKYLQQQLDYIETASFKEEARYWQEALAGETSRLPVSRPEGGNRVAQQEVVSARLDAADTTVLLTTANKVLDMEMNDLLLSALSIACHRCFGMTRFPVHLEGHGREDLLGDIDLSHTIGWFTSIYPVILPAYDGAPLPDFMRTVRDTLHQVPAKGIGYGMLRYLTPHDPLAGMQDPEMCFNYLGQFNSHIDLKGENKIQLLLGQRGEEVHPEMQRYHELEFSALISEGELFYTVQYSRERFDKTQIETLQQHFATALEEMIAVIGELNREQLLELSFNQQNYFSPYKSTGAFAEVNPVFFTTLDEAALRTALGQLQQRHEILRTAFVAYQHRYYMRVKETSEISIIWTDVRDQQHQNRQELRREVRLRAQAALDLQTNWVVYVIRFHDGYELAMQFSHLIFDGYSPTILQAELGTLYEAALQHTPASLPALQYQYSDYARAQRRYVLGAAGHRALSYWKDCLRDVRFTATTPSDGTLKATVAFHGEACQDFRAALQEQGISPVAALLTAFDRIWRRLTGERPQVIGLPVSVRGSVYHQFNNEQIIGYCANILLARVQPEEGAPVSQQLQQVQEHLVRDYEYQEYPYDKLMHALNVPAGYRPPFGLNYYNYQYLRDTAVDTSGQEAPRIMPGENYGRCWWDVYQLKDGLLFNVLLHSTEFTPAFATEMTTLILKELHRVASGKYEAQAALG